ncbi:hypothetical protein GCM10025880_26130 [Methylorubrum aminovorans]|uniref:phosphorylase family protein n=1 Tax=Methylorubrum aminovorans TaxID=269069 RepID=UPI0023E93911|nr:hypothetical protein [Methylorubrum aminovorans]GMA76196.1 hypothetical protein GCM10025880_26130 [Methylorubrum aminovorans]
MRVLVFEDRDDKFGTIEQGLISIGVDPRSIRRAKSLASGVRELRSKFDLYIIDLWLPMVDNGEDVDVTREVVALLDQGRDLQSPVVAITSFAAEAEKHSSFLASKGVHIYDFNSADIWQQALSVFLQQANDRHRYDFIIFTALDEERKAFAHVEGVETKSVTRAGMSFWDFELNGKKGSIVLFPRMGLVSASICTARVLENYAPKIVCMSGICAGVGKETFLGQLLITELCWEYQSGKWFDDFFQPSLTRLRLQSRLELISLSTSKTQTCRGG